MFIGAELVVESTLVLTPNHNFRLELYADQVLLPLSVGTDTYNYNCSILPHKILAATGRKAAYDIGIGLGTSEALAASPIPVTEDELGQLKLRIVNNKILDQAELKHNFSLRLLLNHGFVDLHLARPDVKIYWEGRGEFLIPLGELIA